MNKNPLKVIESNTEVQGWGTSKESDRQKATATFDRLWLHHSHEFDPSRNVLEKERISRTIALVPPGGAKAVDLGCGDGTLSRLLHSRGYTVDAVDVSKNALRVCEQKGSEGLRLLQDYVPRTRLPDDSYELVVAAELIAYLPAEEQRLFMSELARLVTPRGKILCSTSIDLYSLDSLTRFAELSNTEFAIGEWRLSYHKYWIKLHDFFAAPRRFARASSDADYRTRKEGQRFGWRRLWFHWNSSRSAGFLWRGIQLFVYPIDLWISRNRTLLLLLEKICSALSSTSGLSHAIWLGERRPMMQQIPVDDQPKEKLGKKQVWE